MEDLPSELRVATDNAKAADWESGLRRVVDQHLVHGESEIYARLNLDFERVLIQAALQHTGGHKQAAAQKLGLGRNTLTRKLKELGIE